MVFSGKTYKIKFEYKDTKYEVVESFEQEVTATSGYGDYGFDYGDGIQISNNRLVFVSGEPGIYYGDERKSLFEEVSGHYVLELTTVNGEYQSWNWLGDTCNEFDFNKSGVLKDTYNHEQLMFTLYYVAESEKYGDYRFILCTNDESKYFDFSM